MKKKLCILLSFIILLVSINFVYAKSLSELNEEQDEINSQIEQSKQELEDTQAEKSNAQKQVDALDAQLTEVTEELANVEKSLQEVTESLAKAEADLEQAIEDKNNQYETLKRRMRFMYEYGNSSYLELIINAKNISDFFKRVEYLNCIIEYDQTIFEQYEKTQQEYEQKVAEIEEKKASIESLSEEITAKKQELENSIAAKEQLIATLQSNAETLQEQLDELEKRNEEIKQLIQETKITATTSSQNEIYATTTTTLQHPVPAYADYPFNDSYGARTSPITGIEEVHTGLDLKATYGTDIVAAESGTVIYSSYMNGYGYTVMIDHGNNLTTLYAHNSSLVVSVGESVERGQVIAKAGSTGYSTGVHCHFEVRINGEHTDPRPYLS